MPVLRASERAAATGDVLNAWSAMIRRTDNGPSAIDDDLIDCRLVPAVICFVRLTGGHLISNGSKCTTLRGGHRSLSEQRADSATDNHLRVPPRRACRRTRVGHGALGAGSTSVGACGHVFLEPDRRPSGSQRLRMQLCEEFEVDAATAQRDATQMINDFAEKDLFTLMSGAHDG